MSTITNLRQGYRTLQNNILGRKVVPLIVSPKRANTCAGGQVEDVGMVLAAFTDPEMDKAVEFTPLGWNFNKESGGELMRGMKASGPTPGAGKHKVLYGVHPLYSAVAIVGLGDGCVTYSAMEEMDELKETIRQAVGNGVKGLQEARVSSIYVEEMGSAESAAEGASMGVWLFQELKNPKKQLMVPKVHLYGSCEYTAWQIGLQKGAAQNLARQLAETPANILTPIGFAQSAVDILTKAGVSVDVKVKAWIKIMGMEAMLAAASGSCEAPVFIELSYYGCEPDVSPVVLIGKGTTFNSGGLCLKDCPEMKHMRGDKTGAGVIVGAMRAASAMQLPLNIRGLIALTESMPGNCALKPGDIIRAKNGKTILVEDTDFEGRLVLADALTYSGVYAPRAIVDVGMISKSVIEGIGDGASVVFSNNHSMFEQLKLAGMHTGDRVWRMPLWNHYSMKSTCNPMSDTTDTWLARSYGDPCAAAAFLYEFVPASTDWMHIDIFGTYLTDGKISYLRKGMSGRPTRTLIEFLAQMACGGEGKEVDIAALNEEMKPACASNVPPADVLQGAAGDKKSSAN